MTQKLSQMQNQEETGTLYSVSHVSVLHINSLFQEVGEVGDVDRKTSGIYYSYLQPFVFLPYSEAGFRSPYLIS